MDKPGRGPWKLLLRFGLGIAALALLFHFVKFDDVGAALRSATVALLVAGVALNIATRCTAAARTYTLSRAAGLPVSYPHTLNALFIANFWGLALPGVSAGSVATVWRYRGHGVGVAQSVAVLSASRMVELMAFCLLALLGLATSATHVADSRPWAAALLIAVIGAAVVGLLLMQRLPATTAAPAGEKVGLLKRVIATATSATGLLRSLPRRALAQASGWAVLQGVLDALTVLVLAVALGISMDLSQALWINALSYLAILLPISAAGLGMREAAVLAALVPLGVTRHDALALALLMLAMTLFNALLGALLQLTTTAASRQPA